MRAHALKGASRADRYGPLPNRVRTPSRLPATGVRSPPTSTEPTPHPRDNPHIRDDGPVTTSARPSDDLAAVLRWEASGGTVRTLAWGPPVVVALITCDGGQEMQRITSSEADLAAHLRG